MPILESDATQPARRHTSLTSGLGVIFGLFFGLPPAFAIHSIGLTWMPYGFGVLLSGLVVGHALSYLVVTFLIALSPSRTPVIQLVRTARLAKRPSSPIRKRLAQEIAVLERLDAERDRLHDCRFGATTEQRIIWSELLDLELQDIDEQVERIRHTADGPA